MIDIIIPAYNSHKTIIKTLLSIALQTIKDKSKVYIVNDCSKEDYHKEIELFDNILDITELKLEVNSGPGVARQYGIDHSNSEYILFIDSDDVLVDCFSLNNLYKVINNCDIVIGVMIDETNNGYYYYDNHQGCLHGKLYKRSFIEKYNFKFNDTRNSEDNGFNRLLLLAEPNIIYVNDEIYLYRNNKNSITNSVENYKFYDIEYFIYNMIWVVKNAENRNFNKYLIAKHIYTSIVYSYNVYQLNVNRNDVNLILCWVKPLIDNYLFYEDFLTEEDKLDIYLQYRMDQIPIITLKDFIDSSLNYS